MGELVRWLRDWLLRLLVQAPRWTGVRESHRVHAASALLLLLLRGCQWGRLLQLHGVREVLVGGGAGVVGVHLRHGRRAYHLLLHVLLLLLRLWHLVRIGLRCDGHERRRGSSGSRNKGERVYG